MNNYPFTGMQNDGLNSKDIAKSERKACIGVCATFIIIGLMIAARIAYAADIAALFN